MDSRLLTPEQTAEMLAVTTGTLTHWRFIGSGPAFVRIGGRFIRYELAELEDFIRRGRSKTHAGVGAGEGGADAG